MDVYRNNDQYIGSCCFLLVIHCNLTCQHKQYGRLYFLFSLNMQSVVVLCRIRGNIINSVFR